MRFRQEAVAMLASAEKSQQELLSQLSTVEGTVASSQQAFDQSSAELTEAQQSVTRWTDEIAFARLLDELTSQRTQAAGVLDEQEVKLAELQEATNAARRAMESFSSEVEKAREQLESIQASIDSAKGLDP